MILRWYQNTAPVRRFHAERHVMSVQLVCPACDVPLHLPDDLPGRRFQCARCGAVLATAAGGQVLIQAHTAPSANPFSEHPAPPFAPAGHYGPALISREAALAKVRGPAVILLLVGALSILASAVLPLILLVPEIQEDEVAHFLIPVFVVVGLVAGGLALFGGLRMRALKSYALVMAAVIVLLLAGLLICPVAALPAIWPLIVLLDYGVKSNFDTRVATSAGNTWSQNSN
jgi:hypothetical protein